MNKDLLSMPLGELLEKFAAGKHKPGSGSAAALLSLISAALSRTVISLTKGRVGYENETKELEQIAQVIKNEIEPKLKTAFEQDSIQFGRVIEARKSRDKATGHTEWWQKSHTALSLQDKASRIALEIAEVSIRLTELSISVFDNGFYSASGDSEVAMEAALAGATGAISVVFLNLKDFRGEASAKSILEVATGLAEKASALREQLQKRAQKLAQRAAEKNRILALNHPKLMRNRKKQRSYSRSDIFEIARNVHSELWLNRKEIWEDADDLTPTDIIDPQVTFELHGYTFEELPTLGNDPDNGVELAGMVDNKERIARVSRKFSREVRRFTAAHELGHAILHSQEVMFRDRGLDGGPASGNRPQHEVDADSFATYFLMPEVHVRDAFKQIFGMDEFEITQDTAFFLGFNGVTQLLRQLRSQRDLSLLLASTDMFRSVPVRSLEDFFGVSRMAMAIRLEELKLVPMIE